MYQPIPILSIAIGHTISEFDPITIHAMNVGLARKADQYAGTIKGVSIQRFSTLRQR